MYLLGPRALDGLSDQDVPVLLEVVSGSNASVFPVMLETILFVMLSFLYGHSARILMRRGLRTFGQKAMLTAISTMYISTMILWALDLHSLSAQLKQVVPKFLATGVVAPPAGSAASGVAGSVFHFFNTFIGDAIVLWRACVVWANRRMVVVMSVTILMISTLFWILDCVNFDLNDAGRTLKNYPTIYAILALSFSLVSNVWATAAIAVRAWRQRRLIRRYMGRLERSTMMEGVLALLIESGIAYCCLWAFFLASNTNALGDKAVLYLNCALAPLMAIYPTLMIHLVASRKSPGDHQLTYISPAADSPVVSPDRVTSTPTMVIGDNFTSSDPGTADDVDLEKKVHYIV